MTGTRNRIIHGTMAGHDPGGGKTSPWLDLAAAVVKTAADDYVTVLRKLWSVSDRSSNDSNSCNSSKGGTDSKGGIDSKGGTACNGGTDKAKTLKKKMALMADKAELEDFFHSSWYEMLTDIDPERLMYQCRITAKQKEKAAIERANRKKVKALMKGME